jgi:hypothetical protein
VALFSFNQNPNNQKPVSPAARFFVCYIFPWPFILSGALVVILGLRELELAQLSSSWVAVPGVVQSSKITWSHTSHGGSTASAKVVYTYFIAGHDHTSDRVLFGDYGSSDTSHADSIVSQYSPGQAVTVYFDPLDYSQAVLQRGVQTSCYVLPLFGVAFLVPGCAMILFLPSALKAASNRAADPAATSGNDAFPPAT